MTMQEIILDILHEKGMNQNDLAREMKVTRQAVHNMLHNDDIRMSTVITVLNLLGYRFEIKEIKRNARADKREQ